MNPVARDGPFSPFLAGIPMPDAVGWPAVGSGQCGDEGLRGLGGRNDTDRALQRGRRAAHGPESR